jgi:hypothetical protein
MSEGQPEAAMVSGLEVTAEATVIRDGRVIPPDEDRAEQDPAGEERP